MGGNALSVAGVRLPAARYHALAAQVLARLHAAFPARRIESVIAYAAKADFGDMDLLVQDGDQLDAYDPHDFAAVLEATEVVRNGDVTSIGLQLEEGVFQLDLIKTPAESFDFASRYFGLNDMGNLLGRVAHKFGAKFGHLGLLYPIRDEANSDHMIAEAVITHDFALALRLLGYDDVRYESMRAAAQFVSLTDIFQYVVTSPYVNRDIYLLENRNHRSRVRDSKRPTYNAFLDWLQQQPDGSLPAYPWGQAGTPERDRQKRQFLEQAFAASPIFLQAYQQAMAMHARQQAIKQRFNGTIAAASTGLNGKALGELMAKVRASFPDEDSFADFFLTATEDQIKARFLQQHQALLAHSREPG